MQLKKITFSSLDYIKGRLESIGTDCKSNWDCSAESNYVGSKNVQIIWDRIVT